MDDPGFLTLLCRITGDGPAQYRALLQGDGAAQSHGFRLALSEAERMAWLEQLRHPFDPSQPDRWRLLESFGGQLFGALFGGENLVAWRRTLDRAQREGLLLRLVLDIGPAELYPLPWEALFDTGYRFFLALDRNICILRLPRDPQPPPPAEPREPLRLLALVSQPTGMQRLDVAGEQRLLTEALAPLVATGSVELTWWAQGEPATLSALAQRVQGAATAGRPFDVFHYVGHAAWNDGAGEGALLLEDTVGQRLPTTAVALGELLRRAGLRLAVLNACEGSRTDEAAPFRSVAATLISGADFPAVVANQIEVSDRAAKAFAGAFYRTLAERRTVEEAVVAAREAVAREVTRNPEWVATVFFSRYEQRPFRLLAPAALAGSATPGSQPLLTSVILYVLTVLMGITVISFFRSYGVLAGIAVQLAFWAFALLLLYDQQAKIRRFLSYIVGALLLATITVGGWFLLYQPQLRAVVPPPAFTLNLASPSPYLIRDEQLPQVSFDVEVFGEIGNLPAGHHVWILVQAENSATFAAGAEAIVDAQGRFVAADVIVGPPTALALNQRRYTLQPVLVNEAGHRFLQQHSTLLWRFFHPDFLVVPQPRLQSALVIRR